MRPLLIAIFVAILLGLAAFFAFFFRPVVTITVEPATATVTLAGKSATGKLKTAVMPGQYEITIEEEGRVPYKKTERLRIAQRLNLSLTLKAIPQPEQLTQEAVLLVGLSADGKSVQYVANDGKTLFGRDVSSEKALTPNSFQRPMALTMSPTQDVAILRSQSGDYFFHDFKRYNLVEQEQFLYGRDIGAIDWIGPDGAKLLYSYQPPGGERSLIAADRTNKDLERVLNLQEAQISNPTVSVAPDGKTAVLVSRPGNEFVGYNLYLFDFFSKRAKQLSTDGSKVDARFSPAGNLIIYTRFEADPDGINNQLLSVMDVDGRNRKDFALRATLDQVAFLDDTRLAVAVTNKTGSSLVQLDLVSGDTTPYYHRSGEPLHIGRVVLTADKKGMYVSAGPQPQEGYGTLYLIPLATSRYD